MYILSLTRPDQTSSLSTFFPSTSSTTSARQIIFWEPQASHSVNITWQLLMGTPEEIKTLARWCAHNATHDSVVISSLATCHPGTREAVLDRLMQWAISESPPDGVGLSMFWIYGPAGTGKSAIEHTFALRLAEMEKLLATGKVKALGVSNFSKGELETLIRESSIVRTAFTLACHPRHGQS